MFQRIALLVVCPGLLLFSCMAGTDRDPPDIPSFEEFVLAGGADSGYVGDKAAEIEGELTSRVYLDLSGKTETEREEIRARARQEPDRFFSGLASQQIKYCRNKLKSAKLDLNLERGTPTVLDVSDDGDGLWASFRVKVDSLVKYKDLEKDGLTPEDLIGRRYELILPAEPDQVYERGGMACASDPDGEELDPEDVHEYNYFFYFDPTREDCPLEMGRDLVVVPFEVHSSAEAPTAWPEYDLLTADRVISMVALFGQIEHGELDPYDWGFSAYDTFKYGLEWADFEELEAFDDDLGARFVKTYPNGLKIQVDMYNPRALADHRDRALVDQLFMESIRSHEVVYYGGHSFYGSLRVLDRPEAYPQDTYQILFMDSCWSYAYYTKQVFLAKTTESDPDGMKYADVVNNTEPGITGSEQTSLEMYLNLFKGASLYVSRQSTEDYSWNNLIAYMNLSAERRAQGREHDPELYGVSGARDNCFTPQGDRCQEDPDPQPEGLLFSAEENAGIPDNDPEGIASLIHVDPDVEVAGLEVKVEIAHSYISDLLVTLSHDGQTVTLHEFTGGSADDLRASFRPAGFEGQMSSGDWILEVSDHYDLDSGTLESWSLEIFSD